MLAKFHQGMTFVEVVAKKTIYFRVLIVFLPRLPRMSFPDETWQELKSFVTLCHQFFFDFFLDFTVHSGIIGAKPRMGTYQHFGHECK